MNAGMVVMCPSIDDAFALDFHGESPEDHESFMEFAEQEMNAPVEDDLPLGCALDGVPFGGAAVKVGALWVCTFHEREAYEAHSQKITQYREMIPEAPCGDDF
jgi:hypothetical protein